MGKTFIRFCFVAAVIVSLHTGNCNAIEFKGMSYCGWSQDDLFFNQFQHVAGQRSVMIGCNWVAIYVWWFQNNNYFHCYCSRLQLRIPSDPASVKVAVDRCHQLGMKVMLKPMVDFKNPNHWRGHNRPINRMVYRISKFH